MVLNKLTSCLGVGMFFLLAGSIIKSVSLNEGVFICVPVQRYIHGLNIWVVVESSW